MCRLYLRLLYGRVDRTTKPTFEAWQLPPSLCLAASTRCADTADVPSQVGKTGWTLDTYPPVPALLRFPDASRRSFSAVPPQRRRQLGSGGDTRQTTCLAKQFTYCVEKYRFFWTVCT